MDNQRPEHSSMMQGEQSGLEDIPASALEPTFMVTDDIHQESKAAQMFFESLLQSSRSQLLSDCYMSSGEVNWMDQQLGASDDGPVSGNMPGVGIRSSVPSDAETNSVVMRSVMSSVPGTDTVVVQSAMPASIVMKSEMPSDTGSDNYAVRSVPPQVSCVVIGQSATTCVSSNVIGQSVTSHPVAVTSSNSSSGSSVSPKKRSRREQSGTDIDSREGHVSGRQSQGEVRISGRQSQCDERLSGQQSRCESRMSGRQSQCESRMSGRESQCDDRMDAYSDGGSSCVSSNQEKRDGVDTGSTSRRRGSHISEGGRRSRERSESEGDTVADIAMLSSYTSDDTRRQMTGSVTPDTSDVGFQPSMLDAVLTEKKMALLRSPEVRQFLFNLQSQKAREQTQPHSSPNTTKGDNPS
ncbi:uncharacterized protein LOC124270820 isoform X2 [Haliotis rubra]|uniref:uncharacterized protein LOC124270820 isoform X2 n=1 Tax=Haliotis rubra TaxID=36100 RepID=UPI001EE5505B|nr:uncharacterized protein LOC124270820 isoform X2 [Haliotis rubra]